MVFSIHQPHDKLFKLALADPVIAKEFFNAHLPVDIRKQIDLDSLKLEKETFIDEAYKSSEADVVYSTQIKGETGYLYLLSEQQTKVDPWLSFRLLGYSVRIMEMHHRKIPKDPLPLVYPLVVYSGDEPWTESIELFPLFGKAEFLARQTFLKPCQLFDIKRMKDEDLRQQFMSGVVAFALKHQKTVRFEQFLKKLIPWIRELEFESRSGAYLSRIVIKYIINRTTKGNQHLLIEKVKRHLSEELKGEVMTIAQQWEKKGMRKGIQKGIQKGEALLLKRLFQRKFGKLPIEYTQRIDSATANMLLQWGDKILSAENLEEVFN